MCESDNKIIVLNRAGWINKDRILFYFVTKCKDSRACTTCNFAS